MTRRAVLLVLAVVLSPILHAAGVAVPAQDLSGKWDGAFVVTVNGQQDDDTIHMVLTQKAAVLTGTVGPNPDKQWTILNGKIDGAQVTFEAQSDGPLVKFMLALVEGRLKGDALAEMDGMKMTAKIDAARSK